MILQQKPNGELNRVKRTLEEEIEISELAQVVTIFDDELEEAKRDYKEAKKELIKRIKSLKKIEGKTKSAIIYKDKVLNADGIIEHLNNLELQIKNSALAIEEVDKYDFDEKRGKRVFKTEYIIKARGCNRRNSEEERLLKFLNQKQSMIQELETFIDVFNGLAEQKRELIYFSFFKGETDTWIADRLNYVELTIRRLKKETVLQLLDTLIQVKLDYI